MKTLKSPQAARSAFAAAPRPLVLVPTMGALHAGHVSLLHTARKLAGAHGTVAASIFVNPTQFGPKEDFSRYPRPFARDQALCEQAGVDLLFAPKPEAMYASDASCVVDENALSTSLCGASRPGHFRGVCTVVLKLFLICGPTHAVFGRKDFQQCAVIARMVRDLNVPVRLSFAPTVREPDGLALSSRNAYLSPEERAQAPILYQALREARNAARAGERSAAKIHRLLSDRIAQTPLAKVDYLQIIDSTNLLPLNTLRKNTTAALAVFFGRTRLIDNVDLL